MRVILPLTLALVSGCGLKHILPGTAVLSPLEEAVFERVVENPVTYTGPPRVPQLVPPLQIFGLQYALDIVLVSQHPDWEMHEYARLDTPQGAMWIAKDAYQGGLQTIVSDAPGIQSWLPEIPIARIESPVVVTDQSEGNQIDLTLRYTNAEGDPVVIWTQGRMPRTPPAKRNGNTMGHSRDIVAVVLDLERFGSRVRAKVQIGEEEWRLKRLLGLLPFKFLLRQTQGGTAITSFRAIQTEAGFQLQRPAFPEEDWPTKSIEQWHIDEGVASYDNGVCQYRYTFLAGGLAHAQVVQAGLSRPTFQLWISPALPDLRRPFDGTVTAHFRMDVGDQTSHGTGEIQATWIDQRTVRVELLPTAPEWLADRPQETLIHYAKDGSVTVRTTPAAR